MLQIDPTSPRQCGVDANGEPVRLGEISSTGSFVGYISAEGVDWESREEHDIALGSSNLFDNLIKWMRTGGIVCERPSCDTVLAACNILPEHKAKALAAFQQKVGMIHTPNPLDAYTQAILN
jgi:hypothetical protein